MAPVLQPDEGAEAAVQLAHTHTHAKTHLPQVAISVLGLLFKFVVLSLDDFQFPLQSQQFQRAFLSLNYPPVHSLL